MAFNIPIEKHSLEAVTTSQLNALSRIKVSSAIGGDYALPIVLRLLLWSRLPENASFNTFVQSYYVEPPEGLRRYFEDLNDGRDELFVFVISNMNDPNAWFDKYDRLYGEGEVNEPVNLYLKQHGINGVRVYRFADTGTPYVVLRNRPATRIASIHAVASCIPAIIPEYFKDKPITDTEKAMLEALMENDDGVSFLDICNKIVKENDWEKIRLENLLSGFEDGAYQDRINRLLERIAELRRYNEEYEGYIRNNYAEIDNSNNEILGISLRGHEKNNELLDVFLTNKNLHLVRRSGRSIVFAVKSYLDNFDADLYEACRKKERSVFNNPLNYAPEWPLEKWQHLMDAIFSRQVIKPIMGALFTITFGHNYAVSADRDAVNVSPFLANALPNPHLTYYNCFGNNARALYQALNDNDSAMAIALCSSVASNLNMAEPNNCANFINDMYTYRDRKCFELPDGERVDLGAAFAYLDKEEKDNEQTT